MSEEKKTNWSYGVRADGSIWTHFDGPGPVHSGCDWPGNEKQARLAVAAPALLEALERHLPILERAEECPTIWEELTKGTGIATLNGYRHALSAARDGKEAP